MPADVQPDLFAGSFRGPFAEPSPRVFGLPPGADVLREVASGLARRSTCRKSAVRRRMRLWM